MVEGVEGHSGTSEGWNPLNMEGGFAGRSSPFPPLIIGKLVGQCLTQTAAFSFNLSTSASVRRGMDLIHRLRSSLNRFFDGKPNNGMFCRPSNFLSFFAFNAASFALLLP